MEHTNLAKQHHGHTAALALCHFRTQFHEQRFNVSPGDVCACGSSKNELKATLVLPLHACMVLRIGTEKTTSTNGSTRRRETAQSVQLAGRAAF